MRLFQTMEIPRLQPLRDIAHLYSSAAGDDHSTPVRPAASHFIPLSKPSYVPVRNKNWLKKRGGVSPSKYDHEASDLKMRVS